MWTDPRGWRGASCTDSTERMKRTSRSIRVRSSPIPVTGSSPTLRPRPMSAPECGTAGECCWICRANSGRRFQRDGRLFDWAHLQPRRINWTQPFPRTPILCQALPERYRERRFKSSARSRSGSDVGFLCRGRRRQRVVGARRPRAWRSCGATASLPGPPRMKGASSSRARSKFSGARRCCI